MTRLDLTEMGHFQLYFQSGGFVQITYYTRHWSLCSLVAPEGLYGRSSFLRQSAKMMNVQESLYATRERSDQCRSNM
jgi:hypothetical protein